MLNDFNKIHKVEVNGRLIQKRLLKRWTLLAKQCYNRNCDCESCDLLPKLESGITCRVKDYVKGYILLGKSFGSDTEDNNNQKVSRTIKMLSINNTDIYR